LIHHHWIHWHDNLLIWILGACASVLQLHGAYDDQQRAHHSDGDDAYDHLPHALSCDEHGAWSHDDAHGQLGECAFRVRDVS
jgi:hypothetical protein